MCDKLKHDPKEVNYLNISVEEDTPQYVDPNLIELIFNRETGDICFFKKIIEIHQSDFSNQKSVKNSKNYFLTFQSRITYV